MTTRLAPISTAMALAAFLAGSGALRATPASANSGGITGVSGKQGVTCTSCHSGGLDPEVQFIGPATLGLGEVGTYRFEVQSVTQAQRRGGFNVAASDGRLDILPGQNARRVQNNELTHNNPKQNVDMVAGWDFTWTAPDAAGTYSLFGAGNSVNFNGQQTGDKSSSTTFDVVVAEPATATPSPTATPLVPTSTATPAATHTPTGDTPTVTPTRPPVPCVGDCDGSSDIAVNELITGVNIAIGNAEIDVCADFDTNASGEVEISELIAAVNGALRGCV